MMATRMSILGGQLLFVLLLVTAVYAQIEDSCPAAGAACRCLDDNNSSSIVCVDVGQRAVMPAFNSSSRNFSMLSFQGDTRILEIQARAFAGLRVRTLDLSGLGLTSIDPAAFSGLDASVLNELIIANNSLQALPPTVFAGLTSLTVLDLRNNCITQLPNNIFSDLRSSLTSLFISDNRITNGGLQGGVLGRLGQLRRLDIDDNQLTRWSSEMLSGSTKIVNLSLSGNRITAVLTGSFDSLQQLEKLRLERNDVTEVADGAFRNLTSLRELDLSVNRLRNISGNTLEGLESLVTLNLSVNALSALPETVLSPLIALETLDLSHNLLRRLPDGIFANKTTLVTVDLSGNNLTISDGTLQGLTSLTDLFLSENSICTISSSLFADLNQLRVLDLSDNKIAEMAAGLLSFSTALETINLSSNKVSDIEPGVFRNGPSLAAIDLSRNAIRRINRATFHNLDLTRIDLSYNEIEFIHPDAFQEIAALSMVLLNHNRLVEVPTTLLFNIALLENVDLDYNLIEMLPSGAFDLLYVENLSLAWNKIRSIDAAAFEGLWRCRSINLSNNQIEHIPSNTFNYSPLSAVSRVSLSHNSLTEVNSGTFAGLSGLTDLDLSSNRICTIADGTFSGQQELSDLRLDGNCLELITYRWLGDIGTLRSLNLSWNGLNDQALPAVLGLTGLTELYLDSNNITSLAQLPIITTLETLSVRNNSLSNITYDGSVRVLDLGQNTLRSDTLASGLEAFLHLTSLKLDGNKLGVIPSNAFSPFVDTLEELDLSSNELTSTSLSALSDLTSVRTLIMDDNEIKDLSYLANSPIVQVLRKFSAKRNRLNSAAFSVLSTFTKLSTLLLDSNDIDFIPDRVFQSLCDLRVLSLKRNILQIISNDALYGLQRTCRHLDLSSNRLSHVEERAFTMLKNLEHFDLCDNNLTTLTLSPVMPRLRVLCLGGNQLQMFPQLRHLLKICTLNVSGNSLTSLPTVAIFGNVKDRMAVVDFQRNNLINLGDLRLIGSFGRIDFSSNNLNDLTPTAMTRVKYVHQLDLSRNIITVISPTICQTSFTASILNISRNAISLMLPCTLATEDKQCGTLLTTLDLSYNSLTRFPAGQLASLSSSLAVLDIRNNSFDSLPESDFRDMTKLTHLFLAKNPWNCNCDLVWIRQLQLRDVIVDDAKCLRPIDTSDQLVVCYPPPDGCQVDQSVLQPTNDSRCPEATSTTETHSTVSTFPSTVSVSISTVSKSTRSTTSLPTTPIFIIPSSTPRFSKPTTVSKTTSTHLSIAPTSSTVSVPTASISTAFKRSTSTQPPTFSSSTSAVTVSAASISTTAKSTFSTLSTPPFARRTTTTGTQSPTSSTSISEVTVSPASSPTVDIPTSSTSAAVQPSTSTASRTHVQTTSGTQSTMSAASSSIVSVPTSSTSAAVQPSTSTSARTPVTTTSDTRSTMSTATSPTVSVPTSSTSATVQPTPSTSLRTPMPTTSGTQSTMSTATSSTVSVPTSSTFPAVQPSTSSSASSGRTPMPTTPRAQSPTSTKSSSTVSVATASTSTFVKVASTVRRTPGPPRPTPGPGWTKPPISTPGIDNPYVRPERRVGPVDYVSSVSLTQMDKMMVGAVFGLAALIFLMVVLAGFAVYRYRSRVTCPVRINDVPL